MLHAEECYDQLGTLAQMNLSIRAKSHGDGLRAGLKSGIIDCIATDHSPHTLEVAPAALWKGSQRHAWRRNFSAFNVE